MPSNPGIEDGEGHQNSIEDKPGLNRGLSISIHQIGLRGILKENPICDSKNHGFPWVLLKPIP
jgi:hypothetical protein